MGSSRKDVKHFPEDVKDEIGHALWLAQCGEKHIIVMKEKIDGIEFERSTGNVFADLGLPKPEDRLIKSNLTALITKEISQRNLKQSEVGELVGLNQADVSRLLRGRVNRFSVERLFEILNRLGYTVELRITHEDRAGHAANTFVSVSR